MFLDPKWSVLGAGVRWKDLELNRSLVDCFALFDLDILTVGASRSAGERGLHPILGTRDFAVSDEMCFVRASAKFSFVPTFCV